MGWDEKVENLQGEEIALEVMQFEEVYREVRPHAHSDVAAAFVTHGLMEAMKKQRGQEEKEPGKSEAGHGSKG